MKKIIFVLAALLIFTYGCNQKTENVEIPLESGTTVSDAQDTMPPAKVDMPTNQEYEATAQPSLSENTAITPPAGGTTLSTTFVKPTIQSIQQALANAGLYTGKVDGVLGPKTKEAIRKFQSNNNLSADGKVGPKTWRALEPYLSSANQTSSTN